LPLNERGRRQTEVIAEGLEPSASCSSCRRSTAELRDREVGMAGLEPAVSCSQSRRGRQTPPHPGERAGYLPAVGRSGPAGICRPARPGGHRSPRLRFPARTDCSAVRVLPSSAWVPGVSRGGFGLLTPTWRAGRAAGYEKGRPAGPPSARTSIDRHDAITSTESRALSRGKHKRHADARCDTTLQLRGAASPICNSYLDISYMSGVSLTTEGDPAFLGRPRQEPAERAV
jgi:hypothetical protein